MASSASRDASICSRRPRWNLPFYPDIGTGQTQLTWQAPAASAIRTSGATCSRMWRYLDWNNNSGKQIESLNFNGPMIGVTFRW